MPARQLTTALIVGLLLIALGTVPGLFRGLAEGVRNYLAWDLRQPLRLDGTPEPKSENDPYWLAWLGIAFIVLALSQ
jgi:hypothetical protein